MGLNSLLAEAKIDEEDLVLFGRARVSEQKVFCALSGTRRLVFTLPHYLGVWNKGPGSHGLVSVLLRGETAHCVEGNCRTPAA